MDVLIKKSDNSVVHEWDHTVSRLSLPEQFGGDVVFVGNERPLNLGNYALVVQPRRKGIEPDPED